MHKHLLLPLIFIAAFSACGKSDKQEKPGPAGQKTNYNVTSVEGFLVKPSILSENVTASGTIIPAEETELHPEATGRVVSINLPEGRNVRRGTAGESF